MTCRADPCGRPPFVAVLVETQASPAHPGSALAQPCHSCFQVFPRFVSLPTWNDLPDISRCLVKPGSRPGIRRVRTVFFAADGIFTKKPPKTAPEITRKSHRVLIFNRVPGQSTSGTESGENSNDPLARRGRKNTSSQKRHEGTKENPDHQLSAIRCQLNTIDVHAYIGFVGATLVVAQMWSRKNRLPSPLFRLPDIHRLRLYGFPCPSWISTFARLDPSCSRTVATTRPAKLPSFTFSR